VTVALGERGVRGVVLDIEGTTTPIAFVYDALFPYARSHLRPYLDAHFAASDLDEVARLLRAEWEDDVERGEGPPDWRDVERDAHLACLAAYALWLMHRDRKSPGLKLLQGLIWAEGYADGSLRGEVFPDVPPALERWHRDRLTIAIYSSGSVQAQQLLFSTTPAGDLTRFIGHFFDTGVGPKQSPDSYTEIAKSLGLPGRHLLFISDVGVELEAAREAEFQTLLCIRPGNSAEISSRDEVIRSFDEIG
jgi:enolase-phosphatase E1